jgi:hypothetical protein
VEHPRVVGLVVAEQGSRLDIAGRGGVQPVAAQTGVIDRDPRPCAVFVEEQGRRLGPGDPPGVAEPQGGQHRDRGFLGSVVAHGDPGQDLGRGRLGVGDIDRPVPVLVEDAGVQQFQFRFVPAAVMLDQLLVRVGGLRVVVPPPQPGMAG